MDPWAEQQAKYGALNMGGLRDTPKKEEPKKKTRGRGGGLTALISELGGAGGALGGASAGAALGSVVPGIGTAIGGLIGAGLGGFLGGTGGKLAENKIRDDEFRVGEALKEGAISGISGPGPLKAAKAVVSGGKALASGAGREAAREAAESSITAPGVLQRIGGRLSEKGSGIKIAPEVGGVAKAQEQAQFMSKYTGTPRQQLVKMEKDMKGLSKQVDDTLAKSDYPVVGANMSAKIQNALSDTSIYPDLDLGKSSVERMLKRNMDILGKKTGAKEINQFEKDIQATAIRARDKIARGQTDKLTAPETAALVTKRVIDDELMQIPNIRDLKRNMAQIFEATPGVAKETSKSIGLPMASGVSFGAPIQATRGIQSRLGARLQGSTPPGGSPAGIAGRVLTGGALVGNATDTEQIQTDVQPTDEELASLLDISSLGGNMPQEDTSSPYSLANVETNVQRILEQGGTDKDVAAYLSNVESINSLRPSAAGTVKPQSAESAKVAGITASGLSSLDRLQGIIESGGVPKGTTVPGRGLFGGAGQAVLGTSEYDAAADNIADAMVRLRTGAAATKDELALYRRLLPQAFDPPEVQAQKMQQVRDYFTDISGRTGGAGTDIQQAVGL